MLNAGWHLGQIKEESVDPKIQRQSKNEKLKPKSKQNPTSKKNRSDETKRINEKIKSSAKSHSGTLKRKKILSGEYFSILQNFTNHTSECNISNDL